MVEETRQRQLLARDITRAFINEDGSELVALKDFSLEINKGQIIALVGPSGCGKSTFLRLVAGLDEPQAGTLLYNGQPIAGPSPDRGFVFQQTNLYPWLTVANNVAFGLKARGLYHEQKHRVQEMIDLMGLSGFEKAWPHQISGGMASRVALAQTFIQDPGVILLDEPLSALDAFTRAIIQDEIVALWQQFEPIIILVSHDVEEAVYLADRVVVMTPRPGRQIADLAIDLPRPRERTAPDFIQIRREILQLLKSEER
ncbi:MAG: ABC transporter ATP-binding protein [Coriobacteriales bacterium]|nr:ABC transporter ATP-binding protein [Coriobacteriales bacterium]